MTPNEITKFLSDNMKKKGNVLKILFKKRTTIDGIILREKDYEELKEKNFWRVIFLKDLSLWKDNGNIELSRIFNGNEFKKLAVAEK